MDFKEVIPITALRKFDAMCLHNEYLHENKELRQQILSWAADMLLKAREEWGALHAATIEAVVQEDILHCLHVFLYKADNLFVLKFLITSVKIGSHVVFFFQHGHIKMSRGYFAVFDFIIRFVQFILDFLDSLSNDIFNIVLRKMQFSVPNFHHQPPYVIEKGIILERFPFYQVYGDIIIISV